MDVLTGTDERGCRTMGELAVIICMDGCGPEYLAAADTPNLDALARRGWSVTGRAVVPTVTNVNNVSAVTGVFPTAHGITSNYYFDRGLGEGVYMESADYLLAPTVFERLAGRGLTSALLTAKDKLRTLLAKGVAVSASAEDPPTWLVDQIGPPPSIYSVEANPWLLDAIPAVLGLCPELDLVFVSTTDYAMHTYPPDHAESQRHLRKIDRQIGTLAERYDGADMAFTADHGMKPKTIGLDPARILGAVGIDADVVPIIKDRHVVHHQNLGGAAYVYLRDLGSEEDARERLLEEPGVEAVLNRLEAAEKYHLHSGRIGDLMLLADVRTVFGDLPDSRVEVQVRSHGSLHEQEVPIIGCGPRLADVEPVYNKDLTGILFPHQ
jgi:phosphonoacetate hydrolase